ncbi:MAG: non-ribosomal peptide synthetase [Verrucomicrobia bacterium]|nr:non-ribosomal peptide synthetase [Verrucomicrobiota bacterium]
MNHLPPKSHQDFIRATCYLQSTPRLEFTDDAALTQSICDRFDEVVKRYPHNLALKSRSRTLTYTDLDSQANGLAQSLLRLGLNTHERIGLLFNHSALAILAQIGVLKAGYTRVDLSISFPPRRLKQIMEACNIRYLITRSAHLPLAERLVDQNSYIINLDDADLLLLGNGLNLQLPPTAPATVSYSSGSTGEPKQMIRDHVNEMHSIYRVTNSIGINSQDRMLFTMSGVAIPFHALAHGACYYPTDLRYDGDLVALIDWIRDEKISILRTAVSTFRALCWSLRDSDDFPDLRLIVLQGEPVFRADVDAYKKRFPDHCVLVSTFGVSEFGDFAHYLVDKSSEITTPIVPGGYPLTGVEVVLIRDDDSEEKEIGEIGIRGSFISDATSKRLGGLTYTTGDLGRMSPDGCIYHTGRKDFQVKIRGNRVDLLAVEAALLDLDGISQTAVVGHKDSSGDVNLVAYIESPSIDTESVQQKLRATLPDYMVPNLLLCQEKLPRTLTGKIDRKSLPAPTINQSSATSNEAEDVQELPETCRIMMEIWKEVLQLDRIGLDDYFLEIGGDSLKAMMVLARINQTFNVRLSFRLLFESGTIVRLSSEVDSQLSG